MQLKYGVVSCSPSRLFNGPNGQGRLVPCAAVAAVPRSWKASYRVSQKAQPVRPLGAGPGGVQLAR